MSVSECYCVKLSSGKQSIFGLRMGSLAFYLLLFTSFLVSAVSAEETCTNARNYFDRKGLLAAADIQAQPNSDAGGLCFNQGCCGSQAKSRLTQQARQQLESALRSELGKLADVLTSKAKRIDEFFHKLLQLSREGLHAMFKKTYGVIYENHSYVFEDLFVQLERYYTRGDTGFEPMMDGFFAILYEKMFTVLNSQYDFDQKYLKCVNDHMRDYQPFEDVPRKLSVQLRRAFVATRTFHKALRGGATVLRNMMQVGVTEECVTSWARLRFCGSCSGQQPPACSRYCHNVIRGCLPLHSDLGEQWDTYVDALEKVADRLLGPFNIAMVVEPIDIKISEAIMSFQDHNQEISQKIFADCGKPVLGGSGGAGPFYAPDRSRRYARSVPDFEWHQDTNDVDDFELEASYESILNDPSLLSLRTPESIRKATNEMQEQANLRERFLQYMKGIIDLDKYKEHVRNKRDADPEPAAAGSRINFEPYEFEGKRGTKKKKPSVRTEDDRDWGGPELQRLVRDTRQRVRSSKRYWSHIPALLCTSTSVTSSPCFNGTSVAPYTLSAAGEGSAALASNPEVRGALPSGRSQQDALRSLTAKLKDAYNGVEVAWKEADDLQTAGSSVFEFSDTAGSGSGYGESDDDDLPDDDEDRGVDVLEGSGSGNRPDDEDDSIPSVPEPQPPQTEAPFVPNIIGQPGTNNVNVRLRVDDEPLDIVPRVMTEPEQPPEEETPVEQKPVTGAAERPSLQKALFTYALPVVCAWFGSIVTDVF